MNDITEFNSQRKSNSELLGEDEHILKLSRKLLHELDRYRYSYVWSSRGLPIIQTTAYIVAQQEVIWDTKPTIIIETGVARGGSLINSAMSLELNGGRGLVLGIDIDIRPHNREKIEAHKFSDRIKLFQGSSVDKEIFDKVTSLIEPTDRVMVVLDSNHTCEHVLAELNLWAKLVTQGCYLVVADTMLHFATQEVSGSTAWTSGDDPLTALNQYIKSTNKFIADDEINGKLVLSSSFKGYMRAQL